MATLVTGGEGFLGSHLVELLRRDGNDPFIASHSRYELTDWDEATRLFRDARPDLVFHLAAEVGGIGANRQQPGRFWYANLQMGLNILECCRLCDVSKLVLVGTICSYPKNTPVPFREENLWDGYPEETNAPYGVAKKALLVGADAYRQQYALNTICLLPVNLYGPRDNFDLMTSHVIPALIHKMSAAKASGASEVMLWGDGSPTREFLYVEDCAQALLLAARAYDRSEPVNIGSGREISIRELATKIASIVDYDGRISWDTSKPNGQPRRCLDVSRADRHFGFRAFTPLDEGLERTVSWYRAQRSGQIDVRGSHA